jgi:hypothetical protein
MAITLNDLDISGYDLSELGIANGPQMKEILEMLLDEVIEDPMANKKELLVMKAKEIIKTMRDKNSY